MITSPFQARMIQVNAEAEGLNEGWAASFARCLDLIERNAPRLMKTGGGGLPMETTQDRKPRTAASPRQLVQAALDEYLREGEKAHGHAADIARKHGIGPQVLYRALHARQVKEGRGNTSLLNNV